MNIDKEALAGLFDEDTANFLNEEFSSNSEYDFVNKHLKRLKKQITLALSYEQVVDEKMTLDEFENSLKSDVAISSEYKGCFVSGAIAPSNFYSLLSFFGCNILPKIDDTNDAVVFYNDKYRIFVSNFDSLNKRLAILFKDDSAEMVIDSMNSYFGKIEEATVMSEADAMKLSYDLEPLNDKTSDKAT